mmetsp:Transcript_32423/g.56080  ORF Transcript_32423/g.56080 Transcript_32423/m.56080 type:complete len:687 (-) Transcript_32423:118-2178(-)
MGTNSESTKGEHEPLTQSQLDIIAKAILSGSEPEAISRLLSQDLQVVKSVAATLFKNQNFLDDFCMSAIQKSKRYRCARSNRLMSDPVIAPNGKQYEKSVLLNCINSGADNEFSSIAQESIYSLPGIGSDIKEFSREMLRKFEFALSVEDSVTDSLATFVAECLYVLSPHHDLEAYINVLKASSRAYCEAIMNRVVPLVSMETLTFILDYLTDIEELEPQASIILRLTLSSLDRSLETEQSKAAFRVRLLESYHNKWLHRLKLKFHPSLSEGLELLVQLQDAKQALQTSASMSQIQAETELIRSQLSIEPQMKEELASLPNRVSAVEEELKTCLKSHIFSGYAFEANKNRKDSEKALEQMRAEFKQQLDEFTARMSHFEQGRPLVDRSQEFNELYDRSESNSSDLVKSQEDFSPGLEEESKSAPVEAAETEGQGWIYSYRKNTKKLYRRNLNTGKVNCFDLENFTLKNACTLTECPDGSLIVIGGNYMNEVHCIYARSNVVVQLPSLSVARFGHAAVYYDGCVYVMGGKYESYFSTTYLPDCERYHVTELRWEKIRSLKQGCYGLSAIVLQETHSIYAFGGSCYSGALDLIQKYCLKTQDWKALHLKLPTPEALIVYFKVDEAQVYFINGGVLYCFNPSTNSIMKIKPFPMKTSGLCGESFYRNGILYVGNNKKEALKLELGSLAP